MDDRIKIRALAAAKLAPGDASVLAIEGGEFPLEGVRGEVVEATRRIFARGAAVGGEWWPSA
jgi:hypothetical protein